MQTSFLGSTQLPANEVYYDFLVSVLDETWQDRLKQLPRSSTLEAVFEEIDNILLGLHPLHNRRI